MASDFTPALHVVVVGHGMVGHRFVEALRSRDADGAWWVTVLAEETDAAYDRVGLTGYTEHWDRGLLALPGNDYRTTTSSSSGWAVGSPRSTGWPSQC